MIRILTIALALVMTQSCGNIGLDYQYGDFFNVPSHGKSEFDGSKTIRMSKIICSDIVFELYQDTAKAEEGLVLLKAGPSSIANVGKGKSLLFKLDGEMYEFESNSAITERDRVGVAGITFFSYKRYLVSEEFIRKAAAADVFLVRVRLLNNDYVDGKCSPRTLQEYQEQYPEYAISQEQADIYESISGIYGFRKFVKIMDSTVW